MAIVAPLSRYKRNNHMIALVVCLGLAAWFHYDGHYNKEFIDKHTVDGKPDDTLIINQQGPALSAGSRGAGGGAILSAFATSGSGWTMRTWWSTVCRSR